MRMHFIVGTAASWLALAGLLAVAGCGSSQSGSVFHDAGTHGGGDGAQPKRDGASSMRDGSSPGSDVVLSSCVNLECNQTTCKNGGKTTLSGTVYDPAGKVPLYNVIVYIPNAPLQPIATGTTCDQCSGTVSGNPVVSTLTDAKGSFVLENVPVGVPVPLVLQVGKWRRQVTVPAVKACVDTSLTDKNMTRLPKNQSEGDIPRIALATGGADPLECLPRKIGIDDAEFTTAGGTGRVHLYAGGGATPAGEPPAVATSSFAPSLNGGAAFAAAETLWDSTTNLMAYDVVLLACEGQANPDTKPSSALQAMYDFEEQGGRVFASHWHDYWFEDGPAPLPSTGSWTDVTAPPPDPSNGTLDTSFPKGQAFHDWLANVGGLTDAGLLPIKQPKHNVNSTGPGSQQWITLQNPNTTPPGQTAVEYMTFNTPVDVDAGAQCGRVVYSDLHVASDDQTGQPFPTGCVTTDLSPQEKALEFMLFDLSSCILNDHQTPQPPK